MSRAPKAARREARARRGRRRSRAFARSGRPHRTQAERTAATRERILAAVVESIAEVGFGRTTASEIARRAGVTWGAVQHHFGAKDGILEAVLEQSFARLALRLEGVPAGSSLDARIHLFVQRAWEHFASPHFRSTLEILLHTPPEPRGEAGWRREMTRAFDGIWRRLFADALLSARRATALQRYVTSVLTGLSALDRLDGRGQARGTELALLEATLRRELRASGDRGAARPLRRRIA